MKGWLPSSVLIMPGTRFMKSCQYRRALNGTARWKSPPTLTACTALLASSMGVSPLTSTVSVRAPTVIRMSTVTFRPARSTTPSRTNFAKPCSSALIAYSPGGRLSRR